MDSTCTIKKKNILPELWHNAWKYLLLAASLAATVKIIFFGFDIDEQYAVSMAYRMVRGDRMFLEMWEPHQTSAFFSAAFLWLFVHITGSFSYSVLFLRCVGVLMQLFISLFFYTTFLKFSSENTAFAVAVFYYNIIPKNSPVPDFSNMLLWFSALMFLCLLRFSSTESTNWKNTLFWLFLSGVCTSALILSYPTCLFVIIPVIIGICNTSSRHNVLRNVMFYLLTCILCGITWLAYFLSHMSFSSFYSGVTAMFSDGSHSSSLTDKILNNFSYLRDVIPYIFIAVLIAFILWKAADFISKKEFNYYLCLLIVFAAEQLWIWYRMQKRLNYPGILSFFLLFLSFRYYHSTRKKTSEKRTLYPSLYFFGSISSLFLLLGSFLASNTQLYESIGYITIGIIVFLYLLGNQQNENSALWKIVIFSIIGVAILHKGFYISHMYGHDTIFVSRQKAESGPMAGIYGRYSDGYEYNLRNEIMHTYVADGSKVLLVSNKTIAYLQGNYEVCNYSTISTPTIDEQLFTYWRLYPDKRPEYILWDTIAEGYIASDQDINNRLLSDAELLVDNGDFLIYKVSPNSF